MSQTAVSQLQDILASAGDLRANLPANDRLHLVGLADALRHELEQPEETIYRITFNEPAHYLAVRLAMQWGVFDALGDVGAEPKTSTQLAEVSGADPRLVVRFLRHLASNGTIREVDVDTFANTRLSTACRQKSFKDAMGFLFDDFLNVYHRLPSFLAKTHNINPSDVTNAPFGHAHGLPKDKSLYTYFAENTAMAARFGGMVQMYNAGKPYFWEEGYYPFKERLVEGGPERDGEVLLVDIGGGDAGDLGVLRKALGSDVKGQLILFELAHVVQKSSQDGFEAVVGDWNVVQPIEGARAYMLHHILHDFSSDDACRIILKNIIPAMKKGYSKLLIKDLVIPDRDAPWAFTAMDIGVMHSLAGQERTEAQWKNLIESVGLKIEGTWRHERALDAVFETVLPG